MNARKFLNVRVGLTVTAVALSGAMVLSASCAGSGSNGGSGGNSGGNTAGSGGNSGGSAGSTTPSGGGSGSCSAGANSVCFSNGQAQGLMTGWGWVAMGSGDSITDPTCDTAKKPITKAAPCTTQTNWSTADSLCISGSAPAVVGTDYASNWGVQIGVNSAEPNGTGIGKSFTSVTFTTSGSVTPAGAAIRAELHRYGDKEDVTYCANMTSGTPIKLTSFNTMCWDGSGTALTSDDVAKIDKIGVQISGDTTNSYSFTKYCLTGVTFTP